MFFYLDADPLDLHLSIRRQRQMCIRDSESIELLSREDVLARIDYVTKEVFGG